MYHWRNKGNDKFWLILNCSKVIWDINTKFLPAVVLMSFQLFAKFGRYSFRNWPAMPLTILNFSRAWRTHFLSNYLQTWQICFFFVDLQLISVSLLDLYDCLKVEKNEKAFLSICSELLGSTHRVQKKDQIQQIFNLHNMYSNLHCISSFPQLRILRVCHIFHIKSVTHIHSHINSIGIVDIV